MRVQIAVFALAGVAVLFAQDATRKASSCVFTKDQADAGRSEYAGKCATCHGDALGGGDVPPALVGGTFLSSWGGQPVYELFDRIRKSMPPSKEGSLSRAQTAQITAFILSSNDYPAGDTPLPAQDELLRTITVDPKN